MKDQIKTMAVKVVGWAAVAVSLLAARPAQADPQSYTSLAVTNIGTLGDEGAAVANTVTNIGATYKIVQNADAFLTVGVTITGTNNPAGKFVLGHNFQVGDGNWTTTLPMTNTFYPTAAALNGTNFFVGQVSLPRTNFSGLAYGRVDCAYITGATNAVINFISIGWKTWTPY